MKVVYTFLFLLIFQAASFAQDFAYNNFDLNQPKVEQAAVASTGDFDNNIRFFATAQGKFENFGAIGNIPIRPRYNLSPSNIVFNGNAGLNTITILKSGLYHIEGYFNMTLDAGAMVLLQLNMFHFAGLQAPSSQASLLYVGEMQPCNTCGRSTALERKFRASGSFNIEVYIEAGQKIAFFPTIPNLPLLKDISYNFQVRGHLISE